MVNIRSVRVAEGNINPDPPRVITLIAKTATEVFPEERGTRLPEIAARWIMNKTGNDVYLSFGVSNPDGSPSANNANTWNVVISDGELFDVTYAGKCRVCAYAISGGQVSCTTLRRFEFGHSINALH